MKLLYVVLVLCFVLCFANAKKYKSNRILKSWVGSYYSQEKNLKRKLLIAKKQRSRCRKPKTKLQGSIDALKSELRMLRMLNRSVKKLGSKRTGSKTTIRKLIVKMMRKVKLALKRLRSTKGYVYYSCKLKANSILRNAQRKYDRGAKTRHKMIRYYKNVRRVLKQERKVCLKRRKIILRRRGRCPSTGKPVKPGQGFPNVGRILKRKEYRVLKRYLGSLTNLRWRVCYDSKRHGFDTRIMHAKCNNKGRLVTIYRARGYAFGGYQSTPMDIQAQYRFDRYSFLFSLSNPSGRPMKFTQPGFKSNFVHSVYNNLGYYSSFGGGHDMHCNNGRRCYFNLGYSYGKRQGMAYGQSSTRNFFVGQYNNVYLQKMQVLYVEQDPPGNGFLGGSFLSGKEQRSLAKFLGKAAKKYKWVRCYKAKGGLISSGSLHSKCNSKGKTLTLYRASGYTFGGYQSGALHSSGGYVHDRYAKIFSLTNPSRQPTLFKQPGYKSSFVHSTYQHSAYLPTFGGGHDMYCGSNPPYCYFNLGYSYGKAQGMTYGTAPTRGFFTGIYNKNYLQDVEIYTAVDPSKGKGLMTSKQRGTLKRYLGKYGNRKNWKLCYKASTDINPRAMHAKCNYKGRTLTVYEADNFIFGGYQTVSLNNRGCYYYDRNAFIFSLSNPHNTPTRFFPPGRHGGYGHAVYSHPNYLPTFGSGHDLHCSTKCYFNLGHGYGKKAGISYGTREARHFFVGKYNNIPLQSVRVYTYRAPRPVRRGKFANGILSAQERNTLLRYLGRYARRNWRLCYKESGSSIRSLTMHHNCDNKGRSLTIYKADGYVMGGFHWIPLRNSGGYRRDTKAFIFSLRNPRGSAIKFTQPGYKSTYSHSIYSHSAYLATFGGGHDMYCGGSPAKCYFNLGYSYGRNQGMSYGHASTRSFISGRYNYNELQKN